jgi:hypothetical protein
MRITKDLPLPDLAALVCHTCLKAGIDVVLSGGACVSIYTKNEYVSYDLDFVLRSIVSRKKLRSTMEKLGFKEDGRYFRHPHNPYIVDFLMPPLSVGEEPVRDVREITSGRMKLRLLSPTDCVKDRLAAYYHWDDRPSLDQAVLVSLAKDVDFQEVRRWSLRENMKVKYEAFRERYAAEAKKTMKGKRGT